MVSYFVLFSSIVVVWLLTRILAVAKISFYCQRILLASSSLSPIRIDISYANNRFNGKISYQVNLIGIASSIVLGTGDSAIGALKKSLKKVENID